MTFFEYMGRYQGKNTPRGDLFYDMAHDKDFPRDATDPIQIRRYLKDKNASDECLKVFSACCKSYRKALPGESSKS